MKVDVAKKEMKSLVESVISLPKAIKAGLECTIVGSVAPLRHEHGEGL